MPNNIFHKRSLTPGSVPTTSSLNVGEIAINVPDGKIFVEKSGSTGQSVETVLVSNTTTDIGTLTLSGSLILSGSGTGSILDVAAGNVDFDFDTLSFSGSASITGSLRGQISALSISSNTASLNMASNNFFTLTLVNGVDTLINPTNIQPGQTVNIKLTQDTAGTGTVSFPSFVDQATGSLYTGSAVANAIDIVTMITFDTTTVYLSSIRNMI